MTLVHYFLCRYYCYWRRSTTLLRAAHHYNAKPGCRDVAITRFYVATIALPAGGRGWRRLCVWRTTANSYDMTFMDVRATAGMNDN